MESQDPQMPLNAVSLVEFERRKDSGLKVRFSQTTIGNPKEHEILAIRTSVK